MARKTVSVHPGPTRPPFGGRSVYSVSGTTVPAESFTNLAQAAAFAAAHFPTVPGSTVTITLARMMEGG